MKIKPLVFLSSFFVVIGCSEEPNIESRQSIFTYTEPNKSIQESIWKFESMINENLDVVSDLMTPELKKSFNLEILMNQLEELKIKDFSTKLLSLNLGPGRGYGVVKVTYRDDYTNHTNYVVLFFKKVSGEWLFSNIPFFGASVPEWGGGMIDW